MNIATRVDTGTHFDLKPLTPTIGAELHGIDLSEELSEAAIAAVRQALLDWKVIFFRDQDITRAQHIAFARRFGDLEIHPATPKDQPDPEVLRIEHGPNSRGQENAWHSDVTWRATPSLGSILRSIEIPPVGGDTLFANMYAAYEALSDGLKATLGTLRAVHSAAHVFGAKSAYGAGDQKALSGHSDLPESVHPVIITHPGSGRKALYVNPSFTLRFEGWTAEESKPLLDYLYAHAQRPDFVHRFSWKPGSVAFWDNRATWHLAMNDYHGHRRLMHRITIAGEALS